ncbi:ROK family protein [Bacillus taeanensis]|uniref:ROK family protein n=1 Tax=Bacillus taeanensis TaxID=273032 RepID=A0A366Y1K4_9BACI|nr:ROK family protein [Bacillus taeanensis]RBW70071.1 ROK family protein [Bacillus taeanensis]
MAIGDAAYIKKINRSLILSKIIEEEMISRADLSKITKLTRATISVQAADLLEEELIVESQQEHHSVGRKPIMLSINHKAGYALGIDLDYGQITFTLSDLMGKPVCSDNIEIQTSHYEEILTILITQIKRYEEKCSHSRFGIVGIVIGIHGIVTKDEVINFVPRLKWKNKDLKGDLEKEFNIKISIENNANLCSFAEKVFHRHQSENLISISMYSGIGLGMLINGELLKGYHGYAGEMGHMIIVPDGKPCNCGNLGCWELYASESSFFKQLAEKLQKQNLTYEEIQKLINAKDQVTCELMDQFIKYLSIGLNNIINLLNPETIVLNSELLKLYPEAGKKIEDSLTSSISHYHEILISELGKNACVMGACALAIKNFLEIPDVRFNVTEEQLPSHSKTVV